MGLSIAEIRIALAELPEGHIPGPEDCERLARRLKLELHDRVDELNRLLDELSQHKPADDQVPTSRHWRTRSQTRE